MAISESVGTVAAPADVGERKPLMSGGNILMMNLGFFGVQFSFGLTQSAVNPLFTLIGATPDATADPQHRRAHHRPHHPAADRRDQRQDLERPVGPPQAVHPRGRVPVRGRPVPGSRS